MSGATPQLTVAIPARDAAPTIAAQLDALLGQRDAPDFEIVVADDASSDETAAVVASYAAIDPRVRLVAVGVGHRHGPSAARNAATAVSRSERLAFCDADDVVDDHWVHAMEAALRTTPYVAGTLDVQRLNERLVVDARGTAIAGRVGEFAGIRFGHSCNVGIWRSSLLSVGGWDETLPTGEDIDLAMRLISIGVTVAFAEAAMVHYRYRAEPRAARRQAYSQGRVRPELARRARHAGLRGPGRLAGLRGWAWIARHVVDLDDPALRLRWSWMVASRTGQLVGCMERRTLYL